MNEPDEERDEAIAERDAYVVNLLVRRATFRKIIAQHTATMDTASPGYSQRRAVLKAKQDV